MKIAVTRSGGFAGLVQRAAIDTADLPDAAEWHALTSRIDLAALPPPRREPDRYTYEIDIDGKTAEVGETALTGPLRELVDKVMGGAAA